MSSFLQDVVVTVRVEHVPGQSHPPRQLFVYFITIENHSPDSWKLLRRLWHITSGDGQTFTVEGEGVVGEQPLLPPGGRYTYNSFVTVDALPGRMEGHYVMQNAWGEQARVPIPPFRLDVLPASGERLLN
ncbi:MAG: Co2+/Mg2+ efflux protein ApaG [Deinococcus sp.]|uniref:Co2+/Mg2+ efflux protein ApaG n=1 Tax=Deinococcus sp. TaxID=47478 RepID=UPI0026DC8A2E|nr:Co2+/Mg2+ efflux protein ApaG [Deinococcus sp.]MDO4245119.1 Co2+/Mg2+ efflux protein ApaG [Deinococcus sp.]